MFNELRKKTILVTGGAGFIGSNLCEALLTYGASVVCFDDLSTGKLKNIGSFKANPRFEFVRGDINRKNDLARAFRARKIDYVFHYAARVGVIRTMERPLEVFADIEGIKNILEFSKKNKVKKVIFASSSEVYGNPRHLPEREEGPLDIHAPYATVKLFGEQMMKIYNDRYGLATCSLRFFNVYGPRQDSSAYGFVVGIFIKKALAGEPLTVFGDGRQTRDFVYIEDNIHASLLALLSDKTNGAVINIGRGRETNILVLAKMVRELAGQKNLPLKFVPHHKGDAVRRRRPDIAKIKKILHYIPKVDLRTGLKKTIEYYKRVI